MTISTVENATLGAAMGTGIMTLVSQNATAISVICTVLFGLIYVICAISNAVANRRRNQINEMIIKNKLLSNLPEHLQEEVKSYI